MRRRLFWSSACLATGIAVGAVADPLDDVLHALARHPHARTSFIEQHFIALLKRPVESSGELTYDAPDRLVKRTLEPRLEVLSTEGTTVTIRRGGRSRVLDLSSYAPLEPLIDAIRATLAGDRATLEKVFHVEFSGAPASWILLLTPLDDTAGKSVASVQIDGADAELRRVEIRQRNGDRSIMTLRSAAGP